MLLLTFNIWFGPSRNAMGRPDKIEPRERVEALYTELSLSEALAEVRRYERVFEEVFGLSTSVNYNLLSVSSLPCAMSETDMENARVIQVERMAQGVDAELADDGPWRDRFTWDGKQKARQPVPA